MSAPIIFPAKRARHDALSEVGAQVTDFLRQLQERIERDTRLKCATIVVKVAQDYAAGHSTTCHDCEATAMNLGEDARKKIMEEPQ